MKLLEAEAGGIVVLVSENYLDRFKRGWPAHGIRPRRLRFTLDSRTGDILKVSPQPGRDSGEALGAVHADVRRYVESVLGRRFAYRNPKATDPQVLLDEIVMMGNSMHHNATTLHLRFSDFSKAIPGFPQEEAWEVFLDIERQALSEMLSEHVKGKYGLSLTFGFYGRGGATVLPNEWTRESGIERAYIAPDLAVGSRRDYDSMKDFRKQARLVLRVLKDVNALVEVAVRELPESWRSFVEANYAAR
jgi:hypothetical protein